MGSNKECVSGPRERSGSWENHQSSPIQSWERRSGDSSTEWGLGTTVREFLIAFKQCHWMIKGHQLIAFTPITTSQQCHPLALPSLLLPLGSPSSSPMRITTTTVSVTLGPTVLILIHLPVTSTYVPTPILLEKTPSPTLDSTA